MVAHAIAKGSVAAYYPEANVLMALDEYDARSGTPAYKSVPVTIRRTASKRVLFANRHGSHREYRCDETIPTPSQDSAASRRSTSFMSLKTDGVTRKRLWLSVICTFAVSSFAFSLPEASWSTQVTKGVRLSSGVVSA